MIGQRQEERGARKAKQVVSQIERQHGRQMVVHVAALITGITDTMLMVATLLVATLYVTGCSDILGNGDLTLVNMVEVSGDE